MRFPKALFWLVVALALVFPVRFGLSLLHNARAVEEAKRQLLAQIERGGAFEAVLGPMPPKAHIMSLGGGELLGVVFGMSVDEQFRLLVSKLPKRQAGGADPAGAAKRKWRVRVLRGRVAKLCGAV